MKPDLLGYVLQMLEPEEERAVEEYLEATPKARREVMRMHPLLKAMQDEAIEPSKDLVYKTLRAVARQSSAATMPSLQGPVVTPAKAAATPPVGSSAKLPKLEPWAIKEYEAAPNTWRRADAWALIAVVMLILLAIPPVLQFVRDRAGQMECRENMRQLYLPFSEYMSTHGGAIPALSTSGPGAHAGTYATLLKEGGYWGDRLRLGCPPGSPTVPQSMAEVATHQDDEIPYWKKFAGSYAYNLGYIKENNGQPQIMQVKRGDGDCIPILADRPARFGEVSDWATANSPNHGGQGQNILCLGGNVYFQKNRCAMQGGDQDIYRNALGLPHAGKTISDYVLGASEATAMPNQLMKPTNPND
ncbi:MAG TPA: hypothetical protein PLN21_15715 [Gemmatales bacterium]|nr:hypothetical protein [Gemmatales bacterium]